MATQVKSVKKLVTKIQSVTLDNGKPLIVAGDGLKLTMRGKAKHPADAIANLSKGERRRVRRYLDRIGRRDLSVATCESHYHKD